MRKYYDKGVRELCHGVKERDNIAIKEMADYFINLDLLKKDSVIIPAPQHEGYAIYTKLIAEIIAKETNSTVYDILKCKPHEMLYQQKLKGKICLPEFYLEDIIPAADDIFFLDNVLATGTTYNGANILFRGNLKPLIFART